MPGVARTVGKAAAKLTRYGEMVEADLTPEMCTYVLHITICRLRDQELSCGKVCFTSEYWIEQLVQAAKRLVENRAKTEGGKVLTNTLLLEEALARCKGECPDVRTFDQLVPKYRSKQHRGQNLDEGDCLGNQCVGSGTPMLGTERDVILRVLAQVVEQFSANVQPYGVNWKEPGTVEGAQLLSYSRAHVNGDEIVFSQGYGRPSERDSTRVYVKYKEEGSGGIEVENEYAGTCMHFVKATAEGCPPLRFAVTDLQLLQRVNERFGICWGPDPKVRPLRKYLVLLQDIIWKFVLCQKEGSKMVRYVSEYNQSRN